MNDNDNPREEQKKIGPYIIGTFIIIKKRLSDRVHLGKSSWPFIRRHNRKWRLKFCKRKK